jgi:hypothetical protein
MSTLQSQRVADLLDKLFADAEKNDPPRLARGGPRLAGTT